MTIALNPPAVALAVMLALPAVQALPAETSLSLDQYISALETLSRLAADPGTDAAAFTSEKESLPKNWTVEVEHQSMEISTHELKSALAALIRHPSDGGFRKELTECITFMRGEAGALRDQGALDAEKARGRALKILERREFAGLANRGWLDEARARFYAWLNRLFGGSGSAGSGVELMTGMAWFIIAVLFAAAAVLAYRVTVGRSRGTPPRLESSDQPAGGSPTWARKAAEAAHAGEYREAVRCAYWAAVQRLAERGVWNADLTRTHREYLKLLPEADAQRPALSAVTLRFESVWYGGHQATREDFAQTVEHLESLQCSLPWTQATEES